VSYLLPEHPIERMAAFRRTVGCVPDSGGCRSDLLAPPFDPFAWDLTRTLLAGE